MYVVALKFRLQSSSAHTHTGTRTRKCMLWQRLCWAPNAGGAIKQAMRYLHVCMPHKGPKAADSEQASRWGAREGKRTCLPPAKNSLSKLCNLPERLVYTHAHPHTVRCAPASSSHSPHPHPHLPQVGWKQSEQAAIKTTIVKSKHGAHGAQVHLPCQSRA